MIWLLAILAIPGGLVVAMGAAAVASVFAFSRPGAAYYRQVAEAERPALEGEVTGFACVARTEPDLVDFYWVYSDGRRCFRDVRSRESVRISEAYRRRPAMYRWEQPALVRIAA